jgi:T-complex protein 1 subunit delta
MSAPASVSNESKEQKTRGRSVRQSNITAARAIADAVRTSLGPKGMDKMIVSASGDVIITNDGATIVKRMEVQHAAAQMMVDLSHSQDVEAGDGTTSVVVIAGALLAAAEGLLNKGIHPQVVANAFSLAVNKAESILTDMAIPINLDDRESLLKNAVTSLNSKVGPRDSSVDLLNAYCKRGLNGAAGGVPELPPSCTHCCGRGAESD